LLLTACHSRIAYPPGGYPYPEQVADKDTSFYYYPIRNKFPRLDSFRDAMVYESYRALDEPNLSLRPMPTDVFRFTYGTALGGGTTLVSLTPNEITVKIGKLTDEYLNLPDTGRLTPLERRLVHLLDRNYPLDDTSRHHSLPRQHYLDSMGRLYPQLYDPAYYLALEAKEYKHSKPIYTYTSKKIPITTATFDHLVKGFNDAGYWHLPHELPCQFPPMDGWGYSLEANTARQYNYVVAGSCDDKGRAFDSACQELVRYAGLEKMIHLIPDWRADTTRKPIVIEDVQLEDVKEPKPQKPKHQPIKTPLPN
jgi:hypothetical protein